MLKIDNSTHKFDTGSPYNIYFKSEAAGCSQVSMRYFPCLDTGKRLDQCESISCSRIVAPLIPNSFDLFSIDQDQFHATDRPVPEGITHGPQAVQ